jgi:hypothetical protein
VISKGIGFLNRQPRDWKITVARASLAKIVYQMIFPCPSIDTAAHKATAAGI